MRLLAMGCGGRPAYVTVKAMTAWRTIAAGLGHGRETTGVDLDRLQATGLLRAGSA